MGKSIPPHISLAFRKLLYEQIALPNRKRNCFFAKKTGFIVERQRGSHVFLKHEDGRATVVPVHSGETIGPGLLSKILRDVEMTKEELLEVLES
jgi:predicted RNA binding protein YcfA (HicA-like mRNA interferase family)